jgi:hypothetical protein
MFRHGQLRNPPFAVRCGGNKGGSLRTAMTDTLQEEPLLIAEGLSKLPVTYSGGMRQRLRRRGRKGGPFGKMGAPAVRFFHGEPRTPADGLFRPPSTVQPCAIFAAFRGDRASCGRVHAFEFELREDNA